MKTQYFKGVGDLKLLPCPFCGSTNVVYEQYEHAAGSRWRVCCCALEPPGGAVSPAWRRCFELIRGL